MSLAYCLSFFQAVSTLANPVPAEIEKTIKSRVSYQYQIQYPNHEIHFDDPQCEWKGVYTLSSSSLILNADNEAWKGSLELSFNSVLDGKKIDFLPVSPARSFFLPNPESSPSAFGKSESGLGTGKLLLTSSLIGIAVFAVVKILTKNSDNSGKAASVNLREVSRY